MKTNRIATRIASAALCVIAAACGDGKRGVVEPPAPVPGVLTVSLATPNADDRAAVLTITGPAAISSVSPSTGIVEHHRTNAGTTRVAVFGALSSGALLRISVADVNQAAQYTVSLEEVADATNALRPTLTGYTASVVR
ncbi:MAG TPA: hypothetical protein VFJ16_23290 [Longimicrobium sp.]|nr:hypothetical protein [Longimicrobium sp.]